MAVYKRGQLYWCDFVVRGVRTRKSLGTDSVAEARRRERDLIAARRGDGPATRTLHDALVLWLDERPRGRSDVSILARLNEAANPGLDDITSAWCRENLKLSPANYNRHTAIIRAALNLAVEHGWLSRAPKIEKRQEPPTKERFLTREQWASLRTELPADLREIADFAIATGLRQANVLGLRWSQVDLARRVAWVHAADTKGGSALSVPLSTAAVEAVRAQLGRHDEFVFTHGVHERAPYRSTPKTAWLAAAKRAGLAGVRWHDLRHTWASWHVQAGTPLAVLQKLGGWASLEMVQRYAHFAPEHLAAYADAAEVVPQSPPTNSAESRMG